MMKKIVVPSLLTFLLILVSCNDLYLVGYSMNVPILNETGWAGFEVAIAPGAEGINDTSKIRTTGSVIKDKELYKMWYVGWGTGTWSIIYCDSLDAHNWEHFTPVIGSITGTIPDMYKYFPKVIKEWNRYKMWFTGYDGSVFNLYTAESSDGINWGNYELAIAGAQMGTYDAGGIWDCCVINDGGIYKIWYGAMDDDALTGRIYYRESLDGDMWGEPTLVVDVATLGNENIVSSDNPAVVKDGELYRMLLTGYSTSSSAIIYCESFDGINWTDYKVAIRQGAAGTADSDRISNPVLINDNGTGRLWYTGDDSDGIKRTIYCETK